MGAGWVIPHNPVSMELNFSIHLCVSAHPKNRCLLEGHYFPRFLWFGRKVVGLQHMSLLANLFSVKKKNPTVASGQGELLSLWIA